jgi:signal transduction histidine kinase
MITNVPSLKIELECEPSLKIQDDIIADNLLCCIQEALTNILKHSHAKKAWVNIHYDAGDLNVSIRDNGKSNDQIKVGNGLTGIQNRMATIGGSASSEIAEQGGFQVALNLPREALI